MMMLSIWIMQSIMKLKSNDRRSIIADNLQRAPTVLANALKWLQSDNLKCHLAGVCHPPSLKLCYALHTFALSIPRSTDLSPTKHSNIVLGAAIATTPSSQGKISNLSSSPSALLRNDEPDMELFKYVDQRLAAIAA